MKGKLKLLLLLLLFVVTPVFAASDDLLIANDSVTVEEDKAGSAFMVGNDVTAKGTVDGISFIAGNNVNVENKSDYLFSAGSTVKLDNASFKDGFLAGATVEISNSNIERDIYAAGTTVRLSSTIGRDAKIAGSTVVVTGTVNRDLTIAASTIEIKDGAEVKGTLYYSEDANITISPNAKINKKVATDITRFTIFDSFKYRLFGNLFSFANMLVVGLLLLLLVPKIFEKVSGYGKESILSNLGIGLLGLIGIPVISILLLASIVGLSSSLILLAIYVILIYLSTLFASYYIGNMLLSKKIKNRFLILLISLVVIYLLRLIPFVSILVSICTLGIGLGLLVRIITKRK